MKILKEVTAELKYRRWLNRENRIILRNTLARIDREDRRRYQERLQSQVEV